MILKLYDQINDLRLHVLLNYYLTVFLYASTIMPLEESFKISNLILFFTSFAYIFNRYTDYDYDLIVDGTKHKFKNKNIYKNISIISLTFGSIYSLYDYRYLLIGFLITFLGYIYSRKSFFKMPVKNYFLIKNIFAAGSKSLLMFLIFTLFSETDLRLIAFLSFSAFIIHLVYEIMWDIRDIESDKKGKVRTIANTYGKQISLLVSFLLLIFGLLLNVSFREIGVRIIFVYFLTIIFIISVYLLKKNKPRIYHLFIYPNLFLKTFLLIQIYFKN